jgi:hypothetical protein
MYITRGVKCRLAYMRRCVIMRIQVKKQLVEKQQHITWSPHAGKPTEADDKIYSPLHPGPQANEDAKARGWFCPRTEDTDCMKRVLAPGDAISVADIKSFASLPLQVMGLHQFVVARTRAERGLEEASPTLAFDVGGHKFAKSHVAKMMLNRCVCVCVCVCV